MGSPKGLRRVLEGFYGGFDHGFDKGFMFGLGGSNRV